MRDFIDHCPTRIAPSPTGDPHVGTAYIALFNLCFARQHGGQFILRIEDTDQVRSTRESEQQIFDALRLAGYRVGRGPDVGGPHGPVPAERARRHLQAVQRRAGRERPRLPLLLPPPSAWTPFAPNSRRARETPRYDGHCMHLSKEESAKRIAAGESHVVRMKVPTEGVCVVPDMLRGDVEIPWDRMDMQVLMKADGLPTYFLANVVDDHLMGITHVLRGEEWLPSAPKLIQACTNTSVGNSRSCATCRCCVTRTRGKLSKRKNPTSVTFYERMGFMPRSNAQLPGAAWAGRCRTSARSSPCRRWSITSTLKRVSLGGPIFDIEKLSWLNGQWLRDLLGGRIRRAKCRSGRSIPST